MVHEDDVGDSHRPTSEGAAEMHEAPVADADLGSALDATPAGVSSKPRRLGSSRGVETLFRSMYRVHMDLTSIADNKANIMITVNGLILSILLASVGPRLATDPWLTFPTSIALLSSLGAIVFAVLAAKPRLIRSPVRSEMATTGGSNLLFFGNYTVLDEDDFVQAISDLIQDRNAMYHTMMRDLYEIGEVLDHKFTLLQRSYSVFVVGISVSVATFVWFFAVGV
jgi:hypothetical protein